MCVTDLLSLFGFPLDFPYLPGFHARYLFSIRIFRRRLISAAIVSCYIGAIPLDSMNIPHDLRYRVPKSFDIQSSLSEYTHKVRAVQKYQRHLVERRRDTGVVVLVHLL